MATIGRPTKLTPELQDQIVEQISLGQYVEVACYACGISKKLYYDWQGLGEQGKEPYAAFLYAIKKAEAEVEAVELDAVRKAAFNWQAHAWYLERRNPGRWGRWDRSTVKGEINVRFSIERVAAKGADELGGVEIVEGGAAVMVSETASQ